jgi:multiple sugar transport system ATP-binding protein
MAQVSLQEVTKIFPGNVVAVNNVSFDVNDKEFVVLVGPSGCGKSTTLRMIAGLEEATEGKIYIGTRIVNDVPPKDRDIAMVFQNYALYPHMTVYKNMAFGLKLRGFPKAEIDQRVRDAADILGIANLLDRKPKALSGGQRQRVAVGRAIVRKPLVFLFDEPLSNLDAKMRVQMRAEISKLHDRLQSTMIYVTHDQVEAMTMGDRIVVMKDGIIHQIDDPISLYDRPRNKFVAGFIGSPPMNFMEGTIEKENDRYYFNEGNFKAIVPERMKSKLDKYLNKELTFGIRPEDIYDPSFGRPTDVTLSEIKATVEIVEPMGSELYLYLTTGKSPFIARVDAHVQAQIDEVKPFLFNLDKCHFFDTETEEAII